MNIQTKQDAAQELDGYMNWEFGGNANFDGLVDYVYYNSREDSELESLVSDYLVSVGENPEDYQ